jgi:hypothetical protein
LIEFALLDEMARNQPGAVKHEMIAMNGGGSKLDSSILPLPPSHLL